MPEKRKILTQWVEAYTDELYAWAIRKTSNTALSEDLVQDTFLSAAENWEAYKGASKPKTWLFGILRYKIADYYRDKARKAVDLVPPDEAPAFFDRKGQWLEQEKPQACGSDCIPGLVEEPSWPNLLHHCLQALPPLMAQCLELTYLQGKKGKEVYEALNITAANYWQSMSRARLKLRHCLEKARLAPQTDHL
ncbi:MAG: sigma-70 family RNA polymerase sigma factor [Bacteroidetes bacterium]|jgi:RNA polymerase sigma-70 factor (ECF subfamily)|nr:sigma-70 family RNA polymerase sigma factor [Bacteroidota bacterium]